MPWIKPVEILSRLHELYTGQKKRDSLAAGFEKLPFLYDEKVSAEKSGMSFCYQIACPYPVFPLNFLFPSLACIAVELYTYIIIPIISN